MTKFTRPHCHGNFSAPSLTQIGVSGQILTHRPRQQHDMIHKNVKLYKCLGIFKPFFWWIYSTFELINVNMRCILASSQKATQYKSSLAVLQHCCRIITTEGIGLCIPRFHIHSFATLVTVSCGNSCCLRGFRSLRQN